MSDIPGSFSVIASPVRCLLSNGSSDRRERGNPSDKKGVSLRTSLFLSLRASLFPVIASRRRGNLGGGMSLETASGSTESPQATLKEQIPKESPRETKPLLHNQFPLSLLRSSRKGEL